MRLISPEPVHINASMVHSRGKVFTDDIEVRFNPEEILDEGVYEMTLILKGHDDQERKATGQLTIKHAV